MAEEEIIASPEEEQQVDDQPQGPGPGPQLPEANQRELANIIRKMQADNIPDDRIKSVVHTYYSKYATAPIEQPNYRQIPREQRRQEGVTPTQQTEQRLDISQDPNAVARRERYGNMRKQAIQEIESPEWQKKIFGGERPALTDYPDMPVQAFQKVNPKALDEYLNTVDLDPANKYWLRNQLLNYGKFRQSQFYVEQRAKAKIDAMPEADRNNEVLVNKAYQQASQEFDKHETDAIANRLNNIGLDDRPLRGSSPFHDQITGANKALMGVMNYAADLGQQVSSILELGHVPGLSDLGYKLKTTADNLKAKNEIPQNGEAGNLLAGEILPMALDMEALRRLTGAAGRPLYRSLAGARASGTLGKFAEGALGGVAVSPVNSYIIAHQYYNDLVKNGEEPGKAATKADQLLGKNLATDMLMTPLQMGLLKIPAGNWIKKALLVAPAEGVVAGTHFTLQDFNQKSTENPAMHIMDYLGNGEWKSPFITGAALGMLQKSAVDAMENWSVNSESRNMFSFGRQYGGDVRRSLPSNETIANNVLAAMEIKDVPRRTNELKELTNTLHEEGIYSKKELDIVDGIIDDVSAVKDKVPKFGSPQQRMAVFNELLNIHSTEKFLAQAGNEAGEKYINEFNKASQARIQRILAGEEPLYFINGNETNKEQLLRALNENPELLESKGVKIDIHNDPTTIKQIEQLKTERDAIQKQSATAPDVRPASDNSEAMGGRNEGERPVDQEAAGEETGEEELNKMPGADKVAEEIDSGKITDDDLLRTIQSSINETQQSLQELPEGAPAEAGGDQTNGGVGQGSETEGAASVLPETGERATPGDQDTGTEPLSSDTGTADEAGVVQEAGMPSAYIPEFYEQDVKPTLKNISENISDAYNLLKRAYDPRAGVSEKALTHIMKALGDRNHVMAIMDAGMRSFEKMFNKMPDQDRIDFIDRMKRGVPQATPELDKVAKLIRGLDDALYSELNKFKANIPWKENHFRVLWKEIPGSKSGKEQFFTGNRPFEGNRGFMHRATLADMSEGIKRGGVPVSTNPITMFKIAYADGMKYITAQRMWEGLKKDKLVKFVRLGQDPPEGFVKLNDRLANVYFRTPGEQTLQSAPAANAMPHKPGTVIPIPEGHAVYQGQLHEVEYKPGVGPVKAGEYWIDKGAGRLLNNFLSRDHIRETRIGRGLMEIKNLYTAAELGYSGFHALAEGLEAIGSQIGTGIRKMVNLGDFKGGVKDIITSPASLKTTASLGARAIKYATSEQFRQSKMGQEFLRRMPDIDQYIDDMFQGGGLLKQHEDFQAKTKEIFQEQFNKKNYIGAAVRAIPAINDLVMSPLFQIYIPRLKVGMFMKEFPLRLQENAERLAKGDVTRQQLARETIDFVDDRLGEMNFDNLFWNKTFKTAQQFFLRSVTWKLGSIRAIGGILPEQFREFKAAADEGRKPKLMPKAAWALGLVTMQVALATLIQHMLAHKDIESGTDLVAPQINPDDPTERTVLPTYIKDFLHIYHSATSKDKLSYITSSTAGQLSKLYDLWQNKDFYGYEIRDANAGFLKQAEQSLLYVAPKPFSASSTYEMIKSGEPWSKALLSFAGLQKAPGWLTHTDLENKIMELYGERNAGTKPYNEREANQVKKEIRQLFKEGENDAAHEKLDQAIKGGIIRRSQVKNLVQSARKSGDASQYFFSRLPFDDKRALYEDMNEEEKKIYDPKGKLKAQLEQLQRDKEKEE